MFELRWVYHNFENGAPPVGCVCVGERVFQKLQMRYSFEANRKQEWTDWKDILHAGMSNVQIEGQPASGLSRSNVGLGIIAARPFVLTLDLPQPQALDIRHTRMRVIKRRYQ